MNKRMTLPLLLPPIFGLYAVCAISGSTPTSAEVIKIPIGEQHQELRHISKPRRGQKKAEVEQQYGPPVQRYSARGTPPISRWEYPGFIVFFEYDHVIHSVIKHRPNVSEPEQDQVSETE